MVNMQILKKLHLMARSLACLLLLLPVLVATTAFAQSTHPLFKTSDNCMACHNGLFTQAGEDVSLGANWSATMMANSARDPYWQATVRREILDHPEASADIQHECATCHMPMARYQAKTENRKAEVFANLPGGSASGTDEALLAQDGVSCSLCHQITPEGLGTPASLVGGFHVDTTAKLGERSVYGPIEIDSGRQEIMRSAAGHKPQAGAHIQSSELCASCHTLITDALGASDKPIGKLFEQMPYQEWQHSSYANSQSCQDCHMPQVDSAVPISAVLGQARDGVNRHDFRGGNFFIQRMLNRYRNELAVTASSQALENAANRTEAHLKSGAAGNITIDSVDVQNGTLEAALTVTNAGGHKLPTAYPSRRLWIQLTVHNAAGAVVFESGRFNNNGAIEGNDNDSDKNRYEPHYNVIDDPEQVQIYEAIVAGADGALTTSLLTATQYLKDNRLLPLGFDKVSADPTIAVTGNAAQDDDFTDGRDSIGYKIAINNNDGPFTVDATLRFQPIGYRWADNLGAYAAPETQRFYEWYTAMASESALAMAHAQARSVQP
jgi:hypothetical protein